MTPHARASSAQFNRAARANTEAGAEVVIAAGGVVMALLAHAGIHQTADGMPILNGITNLVKLGEMAVKLNQHHGRTLHVASAALTHRRRRTRSPNSANTTAPTSIRR